MKGYTEVKTPIAAFTCRNGTASPSGTAPRNTLYFKTSSIGKVSVNILTASRTPQVGEVYVSLDAEGIAVDFGIQCSANALLGQAFRYNGSAWEKISGYIYTNNSWVQFSSEEG